MNSELLVVVPSRGRPAAAAELARTFAETCTAATVLVAAVDEDDPTYDAYLEALAVFPHALVWSEPGPSTMVKTLNNAAVSCARNAHAIGFMGDDHRPRTHGWDAMYLAALDQLGTGIIYGDDLLQGKNIPTQVAMTANIVRALGHMAPPTLTHLFVDNYWKALGEGAGCLRYLPEVVIEHLHPFAQKAEMDEGYRRVNDHAMYARDHNAFMAYADEKRLATDIAKVRALR